MRINKPGASGCEARMLSIVPCGPFLLIKDLKYTLKLVDLNLSMFDLNPLVIEKNTKHEKQKINLPTASNCFLVCVQGHGRQWR